MTEIRCPHCGQLLFKAETYAPNTVIEIKCRRATCTRLLRISITSTIQIEAISTLDIPAPPIAYKPVEHK